MAEVKELGYVVIEASDLAAWKHFAVDILGVGLGHEAPGESLGLRLDEKVHRLLVINGPADDMHAIGYDCGNVSVLDTLVQQLRKDGMAVEYCDDALAEIRCVERLATTLDPAGNRVEFYVWVGRRSNRF